MLFLKDANSKRRSRENIDPLLVEVGNLTNKYANKAEVNAFFASVFNTNDGLGDTQSSEFQDCDDDKLPANFELVQDLLLQLDAYKSMGSSGINPKVQKELADVIARPLSIIFQ